MATAIDSLALASDVGPGPDILGPGIAWVVGDDDGGLIAGVQHSVWSPRTSPSRSVNDALFGGTNGLVIPGVGLFVVRETVELLVFGGDVLTL